MQIQKNPAWVLIAIIMKITGIVDNGNLSHSIIIRADELEDFKKFIIQNRVMIEDVFNKSFRSDHVVNPVRQLNYFIGLAGLKLVADKRVQKSNVSNVNYLIDQSSLSLMNNLL
jgi:hypothetical protein